jgi:hypothetical protein
MYLHFLIPRHLRLVVLGVVEWVRGPGLCMVVVVMRREMQRQGLVMVVTVVVMMVV